MNASLMLYYDGDCVFCENYARLARARTSYKDISLIDLRVSPADVRRFANADLNVDDGMIVEFGGQTHCGAEAFRFVNSSLSIRRPFRNLIDTLLWLPGSVAMLYAVMVLGRRATLWVQGLESIHVGAASSEEPISAMPYSRHLRFAILASFAVSLAQLAISVSYASVGKNPVIVSDLGLSQSFLSWTNTTILLALFGYLSFRPIRSVYRFFTSLFDRYARYKFAIAGLLMAIWTILINHATLPLGRFYLFLALLPFVVEIFLICRKQLSPFGGAFRFVLPISLLICIVPGFWLGPFYGGISGWVVKLGSASVITYPGIMLERDDGARVMLNDAFHQPHTQRNRLLKWLASYKSSEEVFEIVWLNYQQGYEQIERGRLPHQWFWGDFAYPTHNMTDSNAEDYLPFPPERIDSLSRVILTYDWDGNILSEEVLERYTLDDND